MMDFGSSLKSAWGNMTSSPSEEIRECPHCKQVVPKRTFIVMGIEKIVQPVCRCEAQALDRGVSESSDLKDRREMERKFSISTLGEKFQDARFNTFAQREGADEAAKMALAFAKSFGSYGGDCLYIYGPNGTGKSHLAAAVCHYIKPKGKIAVFCTMNDLLERIRNTFNQQIKETEAEIMNAMRNCDLLVLDDFGSEKITDWVLDVIFRIIDARYRTKKPTLFTSNYSQTQLFYQLMPVNPTDMDEIAARRILDRIIEMTVPVQNKATTNRLEIAKKRTQEFKEKGAFAPTEEESA